MNVTVSDWIWISEVAGDEGMLQLLFDRLTYENPEYHSFIKMQRSGSINSRAPNPHPPQIQDYKWDFRACVLQIPRGFLAELRAMLPRTVRFIDSRLDLDPIEIEHCIEARSYQEEGSNAMVSSTYGVLQAPCGSGKTVTGIMALCHIKQPTFILTHKVELLNQWRDELFKKTTATKDLVGIVGNGKKQFRPITVGTVQTLNSMRLKKPEEYEKVVSQYGCLILDECLDPDTIIATPGGLAKLGELKRGDEVLTPKGSTKIKRVWRTEKMAYRYNTTKGNSLVASSNHLVPTFVKEGRGVRILPIGQVTHLLVPKHLTRQLPIDPEDYLLGWFLGDGSCSSKDYIRFSFRKDCLEIRDLLENAGSGLLRHSENARGDHVFTFEKLRAQRFCKAHGVNPGHKTHTVSIPDDLYRSCSPGVIRGLFDAESSRSNNSILIQMTSDKIIWQLSDMLKAHGIWNNVFRIKKVSDKHKDSLRLQITGHHVNRYNALIGFGLRRKQQPHRTNMSDRTFFRQVRVKSVEEVGVRELVDIELDDEDKLFIANGFAVHNCHHGPAHTFYEVLNTFPARYRFGLSATPRRKDQLEFRLWDCIGPIVYNVENRVLVDAGHISTARVGMVGTGTVPLEEMWSKVITELSKDEQRNTLILRLIHRSVEQGRTVLVLSDRVSHCEWIQEALQKEGTNARLMIGRVSADEREEIRQDREVQVIVGTTVADEGLDMPHLDTLILTSPSNNQGRIKQRVGRIRRIFKGKRDPIVYDLVDSGQMLAMVGSKRAGWYEDMDFKVEWEGQ